MSLVPAGTRAILLIHVGTRDSVDIRDILVIPVGIRDILVIPVGIRDILVIPAVTRNHWRYLLVPRRLIGGTCWYQGHIGDTCRYQESLALPADTQGIYW